MKKSVHIFFITIISLLLFCGCSKKEEKRPPIGLTFRYGFTGGVLQIHNTSSERIMCHLTVINDQRKDSKEVSFSVAPNTKHELGYLEMVWPFKVGEHGHVRVDNYDGKLAFKIVQKDTNYIVELKYIK